jgi:FtsH-binding integral membrane protein
MVNIMETTLLFKTLVILSGQLSIVLLTCFYCLNRAKQAYENKTSFLGMHFRGSENMKGKLDLIPYLKVKEEFPKQMTIKDSEGNDFMTKTVNNQDEVIELLKQGYRHTSTEGGSWLVILFFINMAAMWGTLFLVSFFDLPPLPGLIAFTLTSLSFGPLLGFIMLDMDENDGFTALKIVLVVTLLTGFIGYSDFYSFSENSFFGIVLIVSLFALLVFNLCRFFMDIGRGTVRAAAIFGAFLFSLFLIYDFNYIKKREGIADSNNWETALEMAFILYLDIINLLLEILEAMGNSQ